MKKILAIAFAVILSACGNSDRPVQYAPQPQVVQQQPQYQQPVVIQQAPASGGGFHTGDAAVGALAGAAAMHAFSNRQPAAPAYAPAPQPSYYRAPQRSVTTTTIRKTPTGTITRTTTRRR